MKDVRKAYTKKIRHLAGKRYILLFLNGFFLATLLYFYMEDNYEKQIFHALANHVEKNTQNGLGNEEMLIQNALHLTHELGQQRLEVFNGEEIDSWKSIIHPVTYDLMTTKGSCGSYSYILSRLLQEMNIEVRIPQMKVKGENAGHILVEAKTSYGWVVLDPSFNLSFTRADGKMASFEDVHTYWNLYKYQVPANYKMSYSYDGVRYTNWNKFPVIMPVMKQILSWTIGKEKTETFSMRALTLRKFHFLFITAICIYSLLLLMTFRRYIFGFFRAVLSVLRSLLFPGRYSSQEKSMQPTA
jgi:hypothetical protein